VGRAAATATAADGQPAPLAACEPLPMATGRECEAESRSRRTSSSAARISAADWKRRLRSFSIARAIRRSSASGTLALSSTGAGGSRFRIASNTTADVLPWNVCLPVAIS
jgi:hypothetical protein